MTPCTSTGHRVYVEVIGMPNPYKFDLPQGSKVRQNQQSSLYPALHRLENKNFLFAEWGPTETGSEAKSYRLTAKGRAQLQTETESWERLTEVVAMFLHPLGESS
jgi:DNA-binding PadR family transcriptional regulator